MTVSIRPEMPRDRTFVFHFPFFSNEALSGNGVESTLNIRYEAVTFCINGHRMSSSVSVQLTPNKDTIMLFLLISLLVFPLLAQSRTEQCKFYPVISKTGGKITDCLAQDHRWKVARCLLQRNSLDYTMQCAGWKKDEKLTFDLSLHPRAPDIDIVPSLNTYDFTSKTWNPVTWKKDDDDVITFTPRGLIVAAAQYCTYLKDCRKEFFGQVLACPYEDMREFIPCLACEGTTAKDITDFERFIRRKQFGRISYDFTTEAMNWRKYADVSFCDDELDPDEVSHPPILCCGTQTDRDRMATMIIAI